MEDLGHVGDGGDGRSNLVGEIPALPKFEVGDDGGGEFGRAFEKNAVVFHDTVTEVLMASRAVSGEGLVDGLQLFGASIGILEIVFFEKGEGFALVDFEVGGGPGGQLDGEGELNGRSHLLSNELLVLLFVAGRKKDDVEGVPFEVAKLGEEGADFFGREEVFKGANFTVRSAGDLEVGESANLGVGVTKELRKILQP